MQSRYQTDKNSTRRKDQTELPAPLANQKSKMQLQPLTELDDIESYLLDRRAGVLGAEEDLQQRTVQEVGAGLERVASWFI
jgi:hypothetical protein